MKQNLPLFLIIKIRSYLAILICSLFFILCSLLFYPFVFILNDKKKMFLSQIWVNINAFLLCKICGIKVKFIGYEQVDFKQPSLILSTHNSMLETIILKRYFPKSVFAEKKELLDLPFFGFMLHKLGLAIRIDREKGSLALKQILQDAMSRFRDGWWLILFPEGTRIKPGQKGKIRGAGILIAKQTPNIKTYLMRHNANTIWAARSFNISSGILKIEISTAHDFYQQESEVIKNTIEDFFYNKKN